jgi:phage-related baseplate assembly protein
MSGFSAIDLSQLPVPDVIESLSFESILSDMKTDLISRDPSLEDALQLESEPLTKLLEVCAYRELILRKRINDASRSVMLSSALGTDLDNLAALFGVLRLQLDAGDPGAQPPIPATYEDDTRLRRRVQLSLEGHTTAGSRASYVFWGLSADAKVKDINVNSPNPGEVVVTVLSTEGNGQPDDTLIGMVRSALNDEDVRPLTDQVTVQSANINTYTVDATLILYDGPDSEVVMQSAQQAVEQFVIDNHRLGHDINLSGLYAALHQPGVQQVQLAYPSSDQVIASHQAAFCTSVNIDFGGRGE